MQVFIFITNLQYNLNALRRTSFVSKARNGSRLFVDHNTIHNYSQQVTYDLVTRYQVSHTLREH